MRGRAASLLRPYHCHLRLADLRKHSRGRVFVETGTYKGDGILAALDFGFETIHSIELNRKLFEDAQRYFAGIPQVSLWHGDSAELLPRVIADIGEPITFWLDAHASGVLPGGGSGQTALMRELNAIGGHPVKDHAIFIDDRRLFGSLEWDYLQEQTVLAALRTLNPRFRIRYLRGIRPRDILCAVPPSGVGCLGSLHPFRRLFHGASGGHSRP